METELKVRLESLEGLPEKLERLGFVLQSRFQPETSVLWDRGGELLARREALRLRLYDGKTTLTWKGARHPDPFLKIRPELETEIADLAAMEGILRSLGFEPALSMTKDRAVYSRNGFAVCLDSAPFGYFVELEGDPGLIPQIRCALGLDDAPVETHSYPTLFRRQE